MLLYLKIKYNQCSCLLYQNKLKNYRSYMYSNNLVASVQIDLFEQIGVL